MYLVTTALQELWLENTPMWLLTPGCVPKPDSESRHKWDINGIAPDPFDSAEEITKSYEEIYKIQEQLIETLTVRLNKIHKSSHAEKFWRVHIGPWCLSYVTVIYDRHKRLTTATSNMPGITVIGCVSSTIIPNVNPAGFNEDATDDFYNAQLYTFLCKKLDIPIVERVVTIGKLNPERNKYYFSSKTNQFLRSIAILAIDFITWPLARRAEIILDASLLPRWFEIALTALSWGNIVAIQPKKKSISLSIEVIKDHAARSVLSVAPESCDQITSLIFEMVGICIPRIFVEGYQDLCSTSETIYKNLTPEVIYSTNSWWFNEPFKNWAARCSEQGSKLIGGEHAGAPFLNSYKMQEWSEISIVDYYLSWGWKGRNNFKVIKSPANKLVRFRNYRRKSTENRIMYVTTAEARHNILRLEDFSHTLNWQQRFFKNMPHEIVSEMLVRLHYHDFGWNIKSRLLRVAPKLKFDNWETNFIRRLHESKLCIFDYISTTFLEALSSNIPTVLFLDESIYPIDDEFFPFFQKFKNVHIFHDNPESAALWVQKVKDDPYEWWLSESCQEVVKSFCNDYAYSSKSPLKKWKLLLKSFIR